MKATKLESPPDDVRTEWRRLNDLIDDVEASMATESSDPQLVNLRRNSEGGLTVDISGLVQILIEKGINLEAL